MRADRHSGQYDGLRVGGQLAFDQPPQSVHHRPRRRRCDCQGRRCEWRRSGQNDRCRYSSDGLRNGLCKGPAHCRRRHRRCRRRCRCSGRGRCSACGVILRCAGLFFDSASACGSELRGPMRQCSGAVLQRFASARIDCVMRFAQPFGHSDARGSSPAHSVHSAGLFDVFAEVPSARATGIQVRQRSDHIAHMRLHLCRGRLRVRRSHRVEQRPTRATQLLPRQRGCAHACSRRGGQRSPRGTAVSRGS
jgi:hypothetical protein